jgi:hypothetical protein
MSDLTEEAKAEIAEAIRIVREDRHYSMLRDVHRRTTPPPEGDPPKKNDPPKKGDPPKNDDPTPPPAKDPPEGDPPKKVGLWWGDRLDAES